MNAVVAVAPEVLLDVGARRVTVGGAGEEAGSEDDMVCGIVLQVKGVNVQWSSKQCRLDIEVSVVVFLRTQGPQ